MPFAPGTRLGPYEIQSPLGAGGMGEVYRARDTKLDRDVAIKVLLDLFADDPDRLVRFHREAQLLASLNHPHIAQIYGFHDFPSPGGGPTMLHALVMELVDGPTLADRIAQGAVPIDEALLIARQMAEALEAAHERAIIHRDLKPANIKVTTGDAVKVLDFGLAKALDPVSGAPVLPGARGWDAGADPMNSPTFASPATLPGTVLGTAAYMSPEQARGKPVDKRADIWAFGVVLYEMLTGHRPFDGATASDTIAAVLRQDIDWTRLPPDVPDDVRRLLRRCLERNVADRLHDAADARLVIADALREGTSAATSTVRRSSRMRARRTRTSWGLLAVVAAATLTAGALLGRAWFMRGPTAESMPAIVRFTIEPPPDVTTVTNVALATDGRFLVYEGHVEGESQLFLHRLDGFQSRKMASTEGGRWPFMSPDGAWVAFFRESKIYKVSTNGGDALVVCDVRGGGPGATWDGNGRIIFSRTWLSGLSIVTADGGTPAVLTNPDPAKGEIGHWWPSMLPDGRVLFTVVMAASGFNDARVAVLDPANGKYELLFPGARATWLPSGHIMFYRAGRYQVVRFDLSGRKRLGEAFPVLEDAQEFDPLGDWAQAVTTSSNGAVAYLAGPYVPPSRLTWIDMNGTFTPLAFAARPFVSVKLSPDGRRAVTASLEAGRLLLRLLDLERGTEETPKIDGMNWNPTWLPDGRLSFTSMRKGDFDIYLKEAGGTGAEHAVLTGPDDTDPIAWTRDGRLVFQGSEPDGAYPLKLFDPRQPSPSQIVRLTEQHVENGGALSPDERWLVYQSAATGRSLFYVRPLTGDAPAVPLSRNTGDFPVFLRDGKTLALVRGRQLVTVPWRERDGRFEIGPERLLTQLASGSGWMYGAPFDGAADGRLLAIVRTEGAPPLRIRVVLGWDREVARLGTREPD